MRNLPGRADFIGGSDMPKSIKKMILAVAALMLISGLAACGGGDGTMEPVQVNPLEDLGLTGDGTGGFTGGGGAGSATGACELTVMGSDVCYGGLTNSICQQVAQSMGATASSWSNGATCQSLGYTFCQSSGGYTVCLP